MLSTEARPVELIATNEQGFPRWVMLKLPFFQPVKVLLLGTREGNSTRPQTALIHRPGDWDAHTVRARLLHEIPPE